MADTPAKLAGFDLLRQRLTDAGELDSTCRSQRTLRTRTLFEDEPFIGLTLGPVIMRVTGTGCNFIL